MQVLARFAATYEAPQSYEGYDCITFLGPSEQSATGYTRAEIAAILLRVCVSVPPPSTGTAYTQPPVQSRITGFFRGNGPHWTRAAPGPAHGVPIRGAPFSARPSTQPAGTRQQYDSWSQYSRQGAFAQGNAENRSSSWRLGEGAAGRSSDASNWRGSGSAQGPRAME